MSVVQADGRLPVQMIELGFEEYGMTSITMEQFNEIKAREQP